MSVQSVTWGAREIGASTVDEVASGAVRAPAVSARAVRLMLAFALAVSVAQVWDVVAAEPDKVSPVIRGGLLLAGLGLFGVTASYLAFDRRPTTAWLRTGLVLWVVAAQLALAAWYQAQYVEKPSKYVWGAWTGGAVERSVTEAHAMGIVWAVAAAIVLHVWAYAPRPARIGLAAGVLMLLTPINELAQNRAVEDPTGLSVFAAGLGLAATVAHIGLLPWCNTWWLAIAGFAASWAFVLVDAHTVDEPEPTASSPGYFDSPTVPAGTVEKGTTTWVVVTALLLVAVVVVTQLRGRRRQRPAAA